MQWYRLTINLPTDYKEKKNRSAAGYVKTLIDAELAAAALIDPE